MAYLHPRNRMTISIFRVGSNKNKKPPPASADGGIVANAAKLHDPLRRRTTTHRTARVSEDCESIRGFADDCGDAVWDHEKPCTKVMGCKITQTVSLVNLT